MWWLDFSVIVPVIAYAGWVVITVYVVVSAFTFGDDR